MHTRRSSIVDSRCGVAALLVGFSLALSFLTRLVLLGMANAFSDGAIAVVRVLVVGELYDILVALWLAAPLVVYLSVVPEGWYRRRGHRLFLGGVLAIATFAALLVAVAELVFFDEFNGRFNFVAVDYLIYPTEVVSNIWESYHTAWALVGILAVTVGLLRLARAPLRRAARGQTPLRLRLTVGAAYAAILVALTAVVSPSLARVSSDRSLNEIAGNGYYAFFEALIGVDAPYEGLYASRPTDRIFPRLSHLLAEPPRVGDGDFVPGSTLRTVRQDAPARRLNVVVVLEESLGSGFIGTLHPGDTMHLTPHYDSLAADGTLLTNAFSTGNRTIRALEATTSSLPPLPGIATVRRAQSENLYTLPALLRDRGYRTMFIYGGRALFDGMGHYMRHNGMERVVEQSDFPEGTFATAWGVSDEAIFDRALAEMDSLHATGQPFYTLVLSVSNHRPYTYPAGRIAQNPDEHRRLFAVRYADWALGRFMRQARSHAFFDSTLFVLMGDHGARVYGAEEIPLPSYEVPILLYAPGRPDLVRPGARVGTLASSLDVPPTVMGILGGDYESKFFGRDVLREDPARGRALMTHNAEIALLRGDRLAVLGLHEAAEVYRYDHGAERLIPIAAPAASDRELIEDAIAYYAGADRVYRSGEYFFDPSLTHRAKLAVRHQALRTSGRASVSSSGRPFDTEGTGESEKGGVRTPTEPLSPRSE